MARLIHKFCNHTKDVNCVAFSPDCNVLVSVSGDKTICLRDMNNGLELQHSPVNGHSLSVVCCVFSPDNSILATGSVDNLVMLWDVENREKIKTLQGHTGPVRCCSFSRNSRYLCSASSDETVRLWDLETWKMRILEVPESSLQTCCFSPDDMYIVSGSVRGCVRIWDVGTLICEDIIDAHDRGASGVGTTGCAFSPIYDEVPYWRKVGEPPCFLLATCGRDNTVKLWKVYTASANFRDSWFELFLTLEGHNGQVYDCKFSSDGQLLVSCSSDKTIRLWNPLDGSELGSLTSHTSEKQDINEPLRLFLPYSFWRFITAVAISKNNRYLASGSNDKSVHVWSLKNLDWPGKAIEQDDEERGEEKVIKSLFLWNVGDVVNWLAELDFLQYEEIFLLNKIDGITLMEMNDVILTGLEIESYEHRDRILEELENLQRRGKNENIPSEFLCPITKEMMKDPVIAADGVTYERDSITSWIESGRDTSPTTNRPLEHLNLEPNEALTRRLLNVCWN